MDILHQTVYYIITSKGKNRVLDSFTQDNEILTTTTSLYHCMQPFLRNNRKQFPLWVKIFLTRLLKPKYMVAVAAAIIDTTGKILLGKHLYRKKHPWGLLTGVLEYDEDPE